MNGHIFTSSLKINLPSDIQDIFDNHGIEIYTKEELPLFHKNNINDKTNMKKILLSISQKDKIDVKYKDKTSKRILNKFNNISTKRWLRALSNINHPFVDILLLISKTETGKHINTRIVGFILTRIAECVDVENKYSNIPTIIAIYTDSTYKHTGIHTHCHTQCNYLKHLCVFIYLYALKKSNYSYGIIELPGLYYNYDLLCVFSRYNFKEDVTLKSSRCFSQDIGLPLIVNLSQISYNKLEYYFKNITQNHTEPICNKVPSLKQIKTRMNNYKNIVKLKRGEISLEKMNSFISRRTIRNKHNISRFRKKNRTTKNNTINTDKHALQYFTKLSKDGFKLY